MQEPALDLDRYGIQERIDGYVCPGCGETYPSLHWFHRDLAEDRVRCESCCGDKVDTDSHRKVLDTRVEPWEIARSLSGLVVATLVWMYVVPWVEDRLGYPIWEAIPGIGYVRQALAWFLAWISPWVPAHLRPLLPLLLLWALWVSFHHWRKRGAADHRKRIAPGFEE